MGMYDYFASHALISDQSLSEIHKYCFSPNATSDLKCYNATITATSTLNQHMDIYNIYAPVCTNRNLTSRPKRYATDPCIDYYVDAYLNRPDVQKALHANVTKLDHVWQGCSSGLTNWVDYSSTSIPQLKELMASGTRVWVFSGDIDGRLPFTSNLYSLKTMKLKVKTPWHPWLINQEVGGYTEVYEGNLTFATVRGAGHTVPSYEPRRALALISHFLNGNPLPFSSKD
ncbi:serine carboxypeptidase-like 40 [Apium graveolens]|uniref:serine carboxypeptidase-like 40 n=1 Tax=Apium graveolens TaxID=4045 RepID=UPI003D7A9351